MIFPAVTPVLHCNTHGDCVLTAHGQLAAIVFWATLVVAIISLLVLLWAIKRKLESPPPKKTDSRTNGQ